MLVDGRLGDESLTGLIESQLERLVTLDDGTSCENELALERGVSESRARRCGGGGRPD